MILGQTHGYDHVRWVLAGAYAVSALVAINAAGRATGRERTFWAMTATILGLLAVAKQLHLQEDLTNAGRVVASVAGWYRWHTAISVAFLLLISMGCMLFRVAIVRWLNEASPITKRAALFLILLLLWLITRALSIHGAELWIDAEVAGLPRGWWGELCGIIALTVAAISFHFRWRGHVAEVAHNE